jgi:hypothetical protein
MRTMLVVMGLHVKEFPRLPLLVEVTAVKLMVTGSTAHVTLG